MILEHGTGVGVMLGMILMIVGWLLAKRRRTQGLWLQALGSMVQYGSAVLAVPYLGLMTVFLWLLQTVFVLLALSLWQNARYLSHFTGILSIVTLKIALMISPMLGYGYLVAMLWFVGLMMARKPWTSKTVFIIGALLIGMVLVSESALLS